MLQDMIKYTSKKSINWMVMKESLGGWLFYGHLEPDCEYLVAAPEDGALHCVEVEGLVAVTYLPAAQHVGTQVPAENLAGGPEVAGNQLRVFSAEEHPQVVGVELVTLVDLGAAHLAVLAQQLQHSTQRCVFSALPVLPQVVQDYPPDLLYRVRVFLPPRRPPVFLAASAAPACLARQRFSGPTWGCLCVRERLGKFRVRIEGAMGHLILEISRHRERIYWLKEQGLNIEGVVVEVGSFSEELLEELVLFAAEALAHQNRNQIHTIHESKMHYRLDADIPDTPAQVSPTLASNRSRSVNLRRSFVEANQVNPMHSPSVGQQQQSSASIG